MHHKVKILLETPTTGRVFLDDVELQGLVDIRFDARAGGHVHRLQLTLMPKEVEVTGLADVTTQFASLQRGDG
jgi:hypothetical protein